MDKAKWSGRVILVLVVFIVAGLLCSGCGGRKTASSVDHPDLTAPAMWVTLRSITDERYNVRVTVQKKGASRLKDYTTEEAPSAEEDRNPPVMAQRAYRMTNRLIESILGDPEFQKVIIEP